MFALSISAKPRPACVWAGVGYDFASGPLYAMTQGISVAVGLQDHFDWMQVAASAAGAGIGNEINDSLLGKIGADGRRVLGTDFAKALGNGTAAKVAGGTIAGIAAGLTTSVLNGGTVSVERIAVDAFGNAVGQAFADQEKRGAGGTATAKADDVQAKSEGTSNTQGSSAAGNGDEDRPQWLDDSEAKAKSDADAIAKNVIQQTNDWSNNQINSHPVIVASPSGSTATKQSDPVTSMIEDAATCKTATDCVTTSTKYDQQEAAFKDAANKLRDSDPASANFYDNMAKAAHTASGIAAGDAAVLARQQLQDSPPLPAAQSASMQSPASGYSRYPAYDDDQGDYGIHREPAVVGGNAYAPAVAYISPTAVSPWSDATVQNDPGSIDYNRAVEYESSKTMNIAMLGLGLFGEGVAVVDGAEALWGASRIPTNAAFDASAANSVWHTTPTPGAADSILQNGIDPAFMKPTTRFGPAFYVAEQPETSLAEMGHYGVDPTTGIRFAVNQDELNVLDLTKPDVAKAWGYGGGPITSTTQAMGTEAVNQGYNAIRYFSERATATSGTNLAILDNFNKILKPVMVTPVGR